MASLEAVTQASACALDNTALNNSIHFVGQVGNLQPEAEVCFDGHTV